MQKAKFIFVVSLLMMSLIFVLYVKSYELKGEVIYAKEALVFYANDEKIKGTYLEVNDVVEDIFSYLTDDKNYAPANYTSPLDSQMRLLNYRQLDMKLILTVSLEFRELKKELPLLYESYQVRGFEYLDIYTPSNYYSLDRAAINSLASYQNYKKGIGELTYLYTFEDDFLTFEATFEESSINYLLKALSLEVHSKEPLIIYLGQIDEELITLNFRNFMYSLKQKSESVIQ